MKTTFNAALALAILVFPHANASFDQKCGAAFSDSDEMMAVCLQSMAACQVRGDYRGARLDAALEEAAACEERTMANLMQQARPTPNEIRNAQPNREGYQTSTASGTTSTAVDYDMLAAQCDKDTRS